MHLVGTEQLGQHNMLTLEVNTRTNTSVALPFNEFPEAQQWTLNLQLLIWTASNLKSSALLFHHSSISSSQSPSINSKVNFQNANAKMAPSSFPSISKFHLPPCLQICLHGKYVWKFSKLCHNWQEGAYSPQSKNMLLWRRAKLLKCKSC